MKTYQAVIIGGGSSGLAAALALKQNGIEDIVILEKDNEAGGILNQCIHNGFGLSTFHEQLSGPSYAERYLQQVKDANIPIKLNTMVTRLYPDKTIEYVNEEEGYVTIKAEAVILSVGCYERNRGALGICGTRPAGIYTAGQAQRYLNMDGYLVGKRVFILGSGDIGLIMARRMTLEGAKVLGVGELMPYSNGLPRNMKQCLEDFDIPLYLSHTVTKIYGDRRLEKIEVTKVDENRNPIDGTQMYFDVDTLLLSCGLIPENHLGEECGIRMDPRTKGPVVDQNYMTSVDGIFACGNGLHVHDLVDYVSKQSATAGECAASYLRNPYKDERSVAVVPGKNIGYVVPGILHPAQMPKTVSFYFRVTKPMHDAKIIIRDGDTVIREIKKEHLIPSEMEQVILAGIQLIDLKDSLQFEVEEV